MQETASNLIGRYFKKQPASLQTRRQDIILKDEHPLIIKFATDPYMGTKVEKSIDMKITYDINHITLPKNLFVAVLKEFERLKPLEKIVKTQEENINSLNNEIEDLRIKYNQAKEDFSRLESREEQTKELLNNQIKELNDKVLEAEKSMESSDERIREQEDEIEQLKEEISDLESKLESEVNDSEAIRSKLSDLYFEYKKYKGILQLPSSSQAQDTEDGTPSASRKISLNDVNVKKEINLDYLFSERIGERICEYLDYKEILNLKEVNKFLNIAINNNKSYNQLVIRQIRRKWIKIRDDLVKKLNSQRELADKIPELYVKHAFSKYVWQKETIGEYMINSIVQSENFFNLMLDYDGNSYINERLNLKETSKETVKNTQTSDTNIGNLGISFFRGLVKKLDDNMKSTPFGIDLSMPFAPNSEQSQKANSHAIPNQQHHLTSSTGQKNVHNKSPANSTAHTSAEKPSFPESVPSQSPNVEIAISPGVKTNSLTKIDSDYPEEFFELPESKRQLFSSYYANNPFCVFIPLDLYKSPTEAKKLMLQKAAGYVEDILRALIRRKDILADNKDVLSQLLQVFARMLVYSKVLVQEAKELEALKDYVISKYEETRLKLSKYENSVEDYGEALVTERKLKDFFSKKSNDLEAQLHTKNAKILQDSQNLVLLQNQLKSSSEDLQKVGKEKQDQENKLKVLVKEIKNLRSKNKELEEMNNRVMDGYHDIKVTFDNLDINF